MARGPTQRTSSQAFDRRGHRAWTRAGSDTGRRYQEHAGRGWRILFERPMPPELFRQIKVAAG